MTIGLTPTPTPDPPTVTADIAVGDLVRDIESCRIFAVLAVHDGHLWLVRNGSYCTRTVSSVSPVP